MKPQPRLMSFASADELCASLRTYITTAQDLGIDRHGAFKIAVSGGSLPRTLARALLGPSPPGGSRIAWEKWEIFFADERAVPPDHAESNYGLLKRELLDKIPRGDGDDAGQPTVHAVDEHALENTVELADRYEHVLIDSFASRDSVRLPIFDLVLLGCGPDGHTCSLFPGHALLDEQDAWVAAIDDSPKPPPRRITLTLPVVSHAVNVAFVATGASKNEVLKDIFRAVSDYDEDAPAPTTSASAGNILPCALVNAAARSRCAWFVDKDASTDVDYPVHSSL